jgi:hypothetical protein
MSEGHQFPGSWPYAIATGVPSFTGIPIEFSTINSMMAPAPGTPAVPMEARVACYYNGHLLAESQVLPYSKGYKESTDRLIDTGPVHIHCSP